LAQGPKDKPTGIVKQFAYAALAGVMLQRIGDRAG
jgi:hypothetical protein